MFMKEAKRMEEKFFSFVLTYYSMENNACSLAFYLKGNNIYTKNFF